MLSGYPETYYSATAQGVLNAPSLNDIEQADVCVIGGGYTGLSAALHLRRKGYEVVLLEARRVGWGASGRNGGQVGSGQRQDEAALEKRFGKSMTRLLWELAEEAKDTVRQLVETHAIRCDLTPGQLVTAAKPSHTESLKHRAERLNRNYDYAQIRFVDREELGEMLGSNAFFGATLDTGACHLHALNYALGLARACRRAGVRIYENSAVSGYTKSARAVVRTARGEVTASHVVIACNAYLEGLESRLAARIMPINNFMLATAPLGETVARTLIRDNVCVHDTRFVVNYFRLSADHRLIFGGGENYRRNFPGDLKAFVRPYMLRIFPQLADARIDYAWGGALAITMSRLPHLGRLAPNVFFAQGFSGHGVSMGTLAGKLIAEAMAGTAGRFDVFASIPIRAFPGGRLLRRPGLVAGMLYYALRDRL